MALSTNADPVPPRVFVSYAHDNSAHINRVRKFIAFLRRHGIDAKWDMPAADQRRDWAEWALREIRAANFVMVIASPEYRRRAEGDVASHEGRGVQWEAAQIREEMYRDRKGTLNRFLPVVLPGCSATDIPNWLGPTSTTHFDVSNYTVAGAEELLRVLTDQPREPAVPLGTRPELPAFIVDEGAGATEDALIREIIRRQIEGNETILQADIRQLLLAGQIGLQESDLGASVDGAPDDRRRIEIHRSNAVVEVCRELGEPELARTAETRLDRYLRRRNRAGGREVIGVLTDGVRWRLYQRVNRQLHLAAQHTVDSSKPSPRLLLRWLEAVLASGVGVPPTPEEIREKLGSESPLYALCSARLTELYTAHRNRSTVKVKRTLWARLLTTALGTNFSDEDALFVDHTLLVLMAEVIGHAVVGLPLDDSSVSAADITSGRLFANADITGVIEADFFDWVVEVPGGEAFVSQLLGPLARFDWRSVEHDVMKTLYESIISPQTRHRLGEYYTPDWLAEEIIAQTVTDPLTQRVLDASCGSGTFLFHAIRAYLAASDNTGVSNADAITGAVGHAFGIDVHPVAVTLARVTYLLAIGMDRLLADDRPAMSVPVYLGDSLRWSQETTIFSYDGLDVPTSDSHEMFIDELESVSSLKFPEQLVADAGRFDRFIGELTELATGRGRRSPIPSIGGVLRRYNIGKSDRPTLEQTFEIMCHLHDDERNHIWGYYVRNLARPLWLSRPDSRVDVLVGNPPWLAFRYMTKSQQQAFRAMCKARGLWAGPSVATHQDLSALFIARCIELYLRPGGKFGSVMPNAVLSRKQYRGFRQGHYTAPSEDVAVAFGRPWELHRVKPAFFPVPAAVLFGTRRTNEQAAVPLDQVPEVWSGHFNTEHGSRTEANAHVVRTVGEPQPVKASSAYASRFSNGATVFPRLFFIVKPGDAGPLGSERGRVVVRSHRSPNEKAPWKALADLEGRIEREFIRPLYLGYTILPFRALDPELSVIPWDGRRLLHGSDDRLDLHPGLATWWRNAERIWEQNRRDTTSHNLVEQLDYRAKLSKQLRAPKYRVVYAASGMYLACSLVLDASAVIEHALYWASVSSLREARFLEAILNSEVLTLGVRPLQSRGEHNPRHFDKSVFQLPIPEFDPKDSAHSWLVSLAERAEKVAASISLPAKRFETQRRVIRDALRHDGVAADIDAIVKRLLQ